MATTLMPFARPEQELFAHLCSFESYQSPKPSPRSLPKNNPRSEPCEQCLASELQSLLFTNNIKTMPKKQSKGLPILGSHHKTGGKNKPPRKPSPTGYEYTTEPAWTQAGLDLIISGQQSRYWGAPESNPTTYTADKHKEAQGPSDKAVTRRHRSDRKYSSLLEADSTMAEKSQTRRRVNPTTQPGVHGLESTKAQQSMSSTSNSTEAVLTSTSDPFIDAARPASTRPLQPILRASSSSPKRLTGSRRRVSFSAKDSVMIFKQEDETPIAEARHEWRVDCLPRRTEWEEQMADLAMERPKPYKYKSSMDKHPRSQHSPMQDPCSERVPSPDPDSSLRGAKSPPLKRKTPTHLPWDRPPMHKHRHVDVNCKHEILDPMPCSCEEPEKVYKGIFTNCRECRQKRLGEMQSGRAERTLRGEDGEAGDGWWSKFTKKIPF
ncbi:hypothetical protein TWF730_000136 [Orbilia blumenaviensis]|uniref:Uncharacterized protein n=1 Tax=Orbilia blumenaviensis TaxID=1796055 RepID=A0AAV9VNG0_9PEZI